MRFPNSLDLTPTVAMVAAAASANEVAPGILRTPDERFLDLEGYPFEPHYLEIGRYRVHYLDEGPKEADPILLLHGEPTWSYLYRKMIPILALAGHRVIVPDLVGFGKSDKPADKSDYSYQMQVDIMSELVARLDLADATFFGQDWGGLIGLRVVAGDPDRFARVVISNTGLPGLAGIPGRIGYPLFKLAIWFLGAVTFEQLQANTTFPRWVAYSRNVVDLPIDRLMTFMTGKAGMAGDEGTSVTAGYTAPFPDVRYKAGALAMPYLVPSQLLANAEAWKVFENWNKPFLCAFTDGDPMSGGGEKEFLKRVPGAQNILITGAGHFVQEDAGEELAEIINEFIAGRSFAD